MDGEFDGSRLVDGAGENVGSLLTVGGFEGSVLTVGGPVGTLLTVGERDTVGIGVVVGPELIVGRFEIDGWAEGSVLTVGWGLIVGTKFVIGPAPCMELGVGEGVFRDGGRKSSKPGGKLGLPGMLAG